MPGAAQARCGNLTLTLPRSAPLRSRSCSSASLAASHIHLWTYKQLCASVGDNSRVGLTLKGMTKMYAIGGGDVELQMHYAKLTAALASGGDGAKAARSSGGLRKRRKARRTD